MPYTTTELVQAATGRLLDDLTANPATAEVEGFIARVDGTLNGYLSGAGLDVPVTSDLVLDALEGTATDGVVVLALEARYGAAGGDKPSPMLGGARMRWAAALKAMADGCHPALVAAQESTQGPGGSFMADEAASYVPPPLQINRSTPHNPNTETTIYEGMAL